MLIERVNERNGPRMKSLFVCLCLLWTARGADWRPEHDVLLAVPQALPGQRGPHGTHETCPQRRRRWNVLHGR